MSILIDLENSDGWPGDAGIPPSIGRHVLKSRNDDSIIIASWGMKKPFGSHGSRLWWSSESYWTYANAASVSGRYVYVGALPTGGKDE
jgi:hypothetical protein